MSGLKLRNVNIPEPELDDLSEQLPSETPPGILSRQTSMSQRAMSNTLTSVANLSNLLPTGTLLAFQLLTPVFTSNGVCDHPTRLLTAVLLFLLAASCFMSSFTDRVKAGDGTIYYGLFKGMWVIDYPDPLGDGLPDLSKYRMRFVDWIHATLSVLVFGAVSLRDKYVTDCFYPSPKTETKHVLDIVPMGIGVICSLLFTVFPTRRHGTGYCYRKCFDRQ